MNLVEPWLQDMNNTKTVKDGEDKEGYIWDDELSATSTQPTNEYSTSLEVPPQLLEEHNTQKIQTYYHYANCS